MSYADIVQSAGAIPLDVKATGVDFACKRRLQMADGRFRRRFPLCRPDRVAELKRTAVGWRSATDTQSHAYPFDPPGPPVGSWKKTRDTAAGKFEVSTPAWNSLAMLIASIDYVSQIGVARIAAHRAPLIARLREELPKRGFAPMTPPETQGPSSPLRIGMHRKKLEPLLKAANIKVTLGSNRMRVSPSVYNDMGDIELLQVLPKA